MCCRVQRVSCVGLSSAFVLQDGSETDVDCGGPFCSPCVCGRGCRYDSDCAQSNSTIDGTIYPAGTNMIVCSAASTLCIDLRAGIQAYSNLSIPGFVGVNVSVDGLHADQFTEAVVDGVENTVATALEYLELPLVVPTDVLITQVQCWRISFASLVD